MIKKSDKIFIAGHKGLIGSAILRKLNSLGFKNILKIDKKKLNLLNQKQVFTFLKKNKPKFIFLAAAKVGGNRVHGEHDLGRKNIVSLH